MRNLIRRRLYGIGGGGVYRAVVVTCVCPSSLLIIGTSWPAATAADADASILEPGTGAEALSW